MSRVKPWQPILCESSPLAKSGDRHRILSQYNCLAVKELKLSYHNMDTYQIIWFLDSGNLTISSLTSTQYEHPKSRNCLCILKSKGAEYHGLCIIAIVSFTDRHV